MDKPAMMVEQGDATLTTWVQCDRCSRWRRILKELADQLPEDASWFCEHNTDAAYASCSVEQELSNDEIDRSLSQEEGSLQQHLEPELVENHLEEQPEPCARQTVRSARPPVWQLINENIYTHRQRKQQDEDDIMLCQCKPPRNGEPGCGPDCLNRMLNMECVPEYCPCGDACSNVMFTRRQYAKLDKRRAGAKGFGLFAAQDLMAGQFIIEYVGEVLEEEEYMRRKDWYQHVGQRHYYFMNVGNGEVIDACRKGRLGRFINHSCTPNCETQKWLVHGELAIGLFALEDIKSGEELTFDYNFERYGDKPMRCLCGSESCRGFIGGTQDVISDRDLAEEATDASEDPEPIMLEAKEASDPAIAAILASEVGLGSKGWDVKYLRKRLEQLAERHGVLLDWGSSDEDDSQMAETGKLSSGTAEALIASARADAEQRKRDRLHMLVTKKASLPATESASSDPSRHRMAQKNVGSMSEAISAPQRQPSAQNLQSVASASAHRSSRDAPGDTLQPRPRRRSEVDRKLDYLVGPSGKLRDTSVNAIVRMLRLFNLCDLQTLAQTRAPEEPDADAVRQTSGAQAGPSAGVNGHLRQPLSPSGSSEGRSEDANAHMVPPEGRDRKRSRWDQGPRGQRSPSTSRNRSGDGSPSSHREDGEIDHSRSPDADRGREDPDRERPSAPARHAKAELTARQRARMADASLLLDVLLKTSSRSAREGFCACGALRQLQSTFGRCLRPAYAVVLRKMLRVVDSLPLANNDLYIATSAHGSFVNLLQELLFLQDAEVRSKAAALLRKFPLADCSPDVQRAVLSGGPGSRGLPRVPGLRQTQSLRVPLERGPRDSPAPREPGTRPLRPSRFHGPSDGLLNASPLPQRHGLPSYGSTPYPVATPIHQHEHGRGAAERPQHSGSWRQPPDVNGNSVGPVRSELDEAWEATRTALLQSAGREARPMSAASDKPPPPLPPPLSSPAASRPTSAAAGWKPLEKPPPPLNPILGSPAAHSSGGKANAPLPPGFGTVPRSASGEHLPLPPPPPSTYNIHANGHASLGHAPLPRPPPAPHANLTSPMDTGFGARPMLRNSSGESGEILDEEGEVLPPVPPLPQSPPLPRERTWGAAAGWSRPSAVEALPPPPPPPPLPSQPAVDGASAAIGVAGGAATSEFWDKPDDAFESMVGRIVQHSLDQYADRVMGKEAEQLFQKALRLIVDTERKAYKERQGAAQTKVIERRKLEPKIREYVRESVHRLLERRGL